MTELTEEIDIKTKIFGDFNTYFHQWIELEDQHRNTKVEQYYTN